MRNTFPTMLMILDGFGIAPEGPGNAIRLADTPNLDRIFQTYPGTTLSACGKDVGLPEGQMGNSEVGHMNIGSGRIIYQDLSLISHAIEEGTFFENEVLLAAMKHVKKNGSALHLFGLLSDGGVHSHIDHLIALLRMAKDQGLEKVFVHGFLDGRDVPPSCADRYVTQLDEAMTEIGIGQLATLSGRYYAMDRDNRWERTELAYDAITLNEGKKANDGHEAISESYKDDVSDEFLVPAVLAGACPMEDGDAVIMYNFRPDRARQITRAFVDPDFAGFPRKKVINNLHYVTMTEYDAAMPCVTVAYPPEFYPNTLGAYVSSLGLDQLRIAETEKYAHVTFFFNGGVEEPNPNEDRILIPSPKVATYDLQPEMSAYLVTERLLEEIKKEKYDLIILNFANADMVGHTGSIPAVIKAIEALDACVVRLEAAILEQGGHILLTADHGNADEMLDAEGKPMTAHSLNPVPLVHIADAPEDLMDGGRLCDLAPTLLAIMGIEQPKEMTGHSLLVK